MSFSLLLLLRTNYLHKSLHDQVGSGENVGDFKSTRGGTVTQDGDQAETYPSVL
jgi:hypothetical protein